jgi:EAL and modified HD-GYP domain-containing signal transduction protein
MFLLGVFSLMDAMLGRPISEIVSEIALPEMIRASLLGRPNHCRRILDLVTAFEAGRWSEVSERALRLRQDESQLSATYLEAVDWAQKVFHA